MIQTSMKNMGAWSAGALSDNIYCVSSHHNAYTVQTKTKGHWIIDSGATDHIVFDLEMLYDTTTLNSQLHLPNGTAVPITHIGTVVLTPQIVLTEVLCVPSFHCNLISISKLTANSSSSVVFSKHNCLLQDPSLKQIVEIGKIDDGLYTHGNSSTSSLLATHQCTRIHNQPFLEAQIWHARLGHPTAIVLNKVSVIPSVIPSLFTTCDVCFRAKQQRLPFNQTSTTSYALFDLVHCDLWGTYRQHTHGKCNIFLTIVEEYSKCTWVYLLSDKSQVPLFLQNFIQLVCTQFNITVKMVRSDNGTEFMNKSLQDFLNSAGIIHQTSCPYTPQQNKMGWWNVSISILFLLLVL